MLGASPTGIGIYSDHCASYLEKQFACSVISSYYKPLPTSVHIESSKDITIGYSRFAAFKRLAYSLTWYDLPESLVYTPTHHAFFRLSNQILTIHDLIPLKHPGQHRFQYLYFKYFLPQVIKRCRALFTVSETTRHALISCYGIRPDKVFVVPDGVATSIFRSSTDRPPDSKDRYLLVVGASYPHKNIEELLKNWKLWKGRYTVKIVSCHGKHRLLLDRFVAEYGVHDHVEFLGYINNDELVALYQNCSALVFPSLCEGFGMPPLEAMACGRPAIVSDIPVHREVMGEAAIYITPGTESSWQTAFSLISDERYIAERIIIGREIVRKYSWEKSGQALIEALLSVAPELRHLLKKNDGSVT
jgi:glycosyltransferase involved in cell wall biosynthesis